MLKKKNLLALLTCGLMLSSCFSNSSSTASNTKTSSTSTKEETSSTSTKEEKTNANVELKIDEVYSTDVLATVTGVNSKVVLSNADDGVIYSVDFLKGEKVELTAKSNSGVFEYYYTVSKTVDEKTTNEDVYLDENGAGSFTLDCDSAVVTLVGDFCEDWQPEINEETDAQILEYFNEINGLLFKGEWYEQCYGWAAYATGLFETGVGAAEYVEDSILPAGFNLTIDDSTDENNVDYYYYDTTYTYLINVLTYIDGEELILQIILAYSDLSLVPNPDTTTSDPILDYYNQLNETIGFEGQVLEYFYGWHIDVTGVGTAQEVAELIGGAYLPEDFSCSIGEVTDENNANYIYADSTKTYQIYIDVYVEDEVMYADVMLAYATMDPVPDPNAGEGKSILDYYEALNTIFDDTGAVNDYFYRWSLNATDMGTPAEAAEYIGSFLPEDFSFYLDASEDEINVCYIYLDPTETYVIYVSVYVDGDALVAEVQLSYTTGDTVPAPEAV